MRELSEITAEYLSQLATVKQQEKRLREAMKALEDGKRDLNKLAWELLKPANISGCSGVFVTRTIRLPDGRVMVAQKYGFEPPLIEIMELE